MGKVETIKCECADTYCHETPECGRDATTTIYRIDMHDETGADVCDRCASDAEASGLFTDQPRNASAIKRCVKCRDVIAEPMLDGEELCERCGDVC